MEEILTCALIEIIIEFSIQRYVPHSISSAKIIINMSGQNQDRKRTHEQSEGFVELSVAQLGNSFKGKTDFLNYFSTML